MKLLFDLFPVILFFATYKLASHGSSEQTCQAAMNLNGEGLLGSPILLATVVVIIATIAQVLWLVVRKKKVDKLLWVSLAMVSVFGGATLYLRDPVFMQWKPTILYWSLAFALLLSSIFSSKSFIRSAMEEAITLPNKVWHQLNAIWIGFFTVLGLANLIAAKSLSCDGWVSFKLYGLTGIMFLFLLAQGFMLSKYIEEKSPEEKV